MTQINNNDILKNTVTGASLAPQSGIFDETKNYNVDDQVTWDGRLWKVVNNFTGGAKGDLSNAPSSTNTNYIEIKNTIARATNSTAQTFSNVDVAVILDNALATDEVSVNSDSFTINRGGVYKIRYSVFGKNTTSTRSNPITYLELNGTKYDATTSYGYARNVADGGFTIGKEVAAHLNSGDELKIMVKNSDATLLKLVDYSSLFEVEFCPNTYMPVP